MYLTTPLHQRRIQVVRSNRVARKRPAESNGTPAMDPGHLNINLTYTFPHYCEEAVKITGRFYFETKNRKTGT